MYSTRYLVLVVVSAVVKASGMNLDGNSGDGAPEAVRYCLVLATPATTISVPLDPHVAGGGVAGGVVEHNGGIRAKTVF